jgi:hypothetical protein
MVHAGEIDPCWARSAEKDEEPLPRAFILFWRLTRRPTAIKLGTPPFRISASDRDTQSDPIERCALCFESIVARRNDSHLR